MATSSAGTGATPTKTLSVGLRELRRWVGCLSLHGLMHGTRMRWLAFLLGRSRTPAGVENAFRRVKEMIRRCNRCILAMAERIAASPAVFRSFVTARPTEVPWLIDAFTWLVVALEEKERGGICVSTYGDICSVNEKLTASGATPFPTIDYVVRICPCSLGADYRLSGMSTLAAGFFGELTALAFGKVALPRLRQILESPLPAARAYASAAICSFPSGSDTGQELIRIASFSSRNPFARRATGLLGRIGSPECIDVLRRLAGHQRDDEVVSEARAVLDTLRVKLDPKGE